MQASYTHTYIHIKYTAMLMELKLGNLIRIKIHWPPYENRIKDGFNFCFFFSHLHFLNFSSFFVFETV